MSLLRDYGGAYHALPQDTSSLPGIIKYPLGLLGEIGWTLDWPGRQLRKLITGLPDEEATGRAVLEKIGILGKNKEGFDAGDVAGFGAEVALDPLTWLTGGLTTAGKSAARLSKLTKYAKAAENVPEAARFSEETAKKIAQLVGEGAKPLAEGWKAQGLAGQRELLRFHVPFTKIDKTLIKAPGILAGMEGLGTKIAGMGGPVKWLRKGFDPSYGKPADLAEDEIIRNIIRREGTQAAEEAAPKFGLKEDPTLVRGIEAWGKPEDLLAAEKGAGITAKAKAAEIRQQGEVVYKAKRQQLADMISERGLPEAEKARFAAQAFAGSTIDQKIADILERPALKGLRDAEREAGTLVAEKSEKAWRRTVAMLDKADELEAAGRSGEAQVLFERAMRADLAGKRKIADQWLKKAARMENAPEEARALTEKAYTFWNNEISNWERRANIIGERARIKAGKIQGTADAMRQEGLAAKEGLKYENLYQKIISQTGNKARKAAEKPMSPSELASIDRKLKTLGKRTAVNIARLRKEGAHAEGALKALTPEKTALVPEFNAITERLNEQAIKEGLYTRGMERYYPRNMGPGAVEFNEKYPTMADQLRREFSTESGFQEQRQIRNLGTPEAAALMSKAKGVEKPYYQLAPGKALYQRMSQQAEDIANLRFAQSIVNKAVPYKQGLTMPVEAFAEGIKGNLKIKPGTGIPFEHAAYYKRLTETSHLPPEIRDAVNLFDKVSGFYRLAVTRLFPAFHGRNIINDLTQTAESGIFNIRDAPAAAKMSGDEKAVRQLEPLGFIGGSRSAEMRSQLGAELKAPKSKAMQALETKYLNRSENFTRILHFLNAKRAGMTDLEAAEHVNKWLLNYSNLTPWEKTVMRRGAFFYSWPALMAKSLPKFAAENPQGYAFLTRAMTQPTIQRDSAIPEFMRQSIALPAGKDPQGNPQYVTGIGSPLDVLNKFDVTSPAGLPGMPAAIMRKLGAELNPLIKFPLEAAAGKEFFMDRPIIQGTKAPAALNLPGLKQLFGTREEKTATGGTRYEANPFMLHMLRSSPLSRLMQTGSQVADIFAPEKQKAPLARIAQLLTGVRVPSVDPVDKLRTEVKLMRDRFTPLQAAGKAGTVEEPFLTKEGKLDPEALRLMEQFRSTRKKLRTTREQGQFVVPP